jgi:hypothetical protein
MAKHSGSNYGAVDWQALVKSSKRCRSVVWATHTVLREAYFNELQLVGNWQETLVSAWGNLEQDLGVPKSLTPRAPAFPVRYRKSLTGLGYAQEKAYPV